MASPDQTSPSAGSRAADDPLAIEIDAARIAPDTWYAVTLPVLSASSGAHAGISARFGWGEAMAPAMPVATPEAAPLGNDNQPVETTPQEEIVVPLVPEPDSLFVPRPPANDDSGAPRLRRVIRRHSLADLALDARDKADEAEPLAGPAPAFAEPAMPVPVMPLPVQGPIDWPNRHLARHQVAPQRLDKSAVTTLIVIMAIVWSVGVGFGIYKLTVPGSGAPIQWRK